MIKDLNLNHFALLYDKEFKSEQFPLCFITKNLILLSFITKNLNLNKFRFACKERNL